MNEQIQKLAIEAGWLDDKQFSTLNKLWQWQNFDKEKFAQLIVRECMDTVANCKGTTKFDHWSAIKEHFGVE